MLIGILTFHYADNYGALLQAFALQKYLSENGHTVYFLNYIPEKEKKFYSDKIFCSDGIKLLAKKIISNIQRKDSIKVFSNFRAKYFSIPITGKIMNNTDALIVGSDQVWNERIVGNIEPYLFAGEAVGIKKISYAASIGSTHVTDKSLNMLSMYLKDFYAISVREYTSELLLSSIGIKCQTVSDPVFLLEKKFWDVFAKAPGNLKKHYILVYLLRLDERIIAQANKYAKEHNIKLYYIHPMGVQVNKLKGKRIRGVGPEEFVWLIRNADKVFTNSFHAVAFCAIFNISFFHVNQEELGNRVSDLLKSLKAIEQDNGEYKVKVNSNEFINMISESKRFLDESIGALE